MCDKKINEKMISIIIILILAILFTHTHFDLLFFLFVSVRFDSIWNLIKLGKDNVDVHDDDRKNRSLPKQQQHLSLSFCCHSFSLSLSMLPINIEHYHIGIYLILLYVIHGCKFIFFLVFHCHDADICVVCMCVW